MDGKMNPPTTIDEYIAPFPEEIRQILSQIRSVIHTAAPQAVEKISYQMPAFYLNGNLVYFAAFKNHIGFYPTGSGIEAFQGQLQDYNFSKGAIQFPLNRPIPYDLIERIVRFRVEENLKKTSKRR